MILEKFYFIWLRNITLLTYWQFHLLNKPILI